MATVRNSIMLNDSMGSVIKSIVRDMDMAIGSMERLDSLSDRLNLGSSFDHATSSVSALNRSIEPMDDSLRRASDEQRRFNNRIRDGRKGKNYGDYISRSKKSRSGQIKHSSYR